MEPGAYALIALQVIKAITAAVEAYENGNLTEEELQAKWHAAGINVAAANDLWERSGEG